METVSWILLCRYRKNVPDYSARKEKQDLGYITFDLEADLTPLFNWNAKQLFVFLTAEYETQDNKLNQVSHIWFVMIFVNGLFWCVSCLKVVLWDKIIRRGQYAELNLKNMNTNYYFWDDGNGLKGNTNVTLTLNWNIIPNAGTMPLKRATGSHSFSFPSEYTNVRAQ